MIDTVLFDLDGTLLPVNTERFIESYFKVMGKTFLDITDPETLKRNIWMATSEMLNNNGDKCNEDVFMEAFSKLVDLDINIYRNRFDYFYDNEFLATRDTVEDVPSMKKAVKALKEKGYKLAVVTNPIFPVKAIQHRIAWAGFELEDFIYISNYEENCYCKPNIKFYEEVLKDIEKAPEECLMVGNDVQEDLVVSDLGMPTYLITDYIIDRGNAKYKPTFKGTYNDFLLYATEILPDIK